MIDGLDGRIPGADGIDTAKALNEAYRIPVHVVVDEVIAILKVLAFRDAIRSDEQVDLRP